MYDIAGSIVLFQNSPQQVLEATSSFLDNQLNTRLYVIDNSPDDRMRKHWTDDRVTYVFNGGNLGFGAAHNIALRTTIAQARFHLVLNPDVYFAGGVLEKLFTFASSRPDIGLIMPKVLYPDGSIQHLCKRLPTPSDLFIRRFVPKFFMPLAARHQAQYEFRDKDYDSILSVPSLSGCFMLMNCAALAQVGLFDERYFLYLEDVDLCRRIHQQFETIYFPEVAIYHRYQKGSYRSPRLMLHHVVSALRYFHKWGWYRDSERTHINQKTVSDFLRE